MVTGVWPTVGENRTSSGASSPSGRVLVNDTDLVSPIGTVTVMLLPWRPFSEPVRVQS